MSNITAMRAFWRRMNYYLNTPVFIKYGRSVRDFLIVSGLTLFTLMAFLIIIILIVPDGDMTGIGSCGTPECIDQ